MFLNLKKLGKIIFVTAKSESLSCMHTAQHNNHSQAAGPGIL